MGNKNSFIVILMLLCTAACTGNDNETVFDLGGIDEIDQGQPVVFEINDKKIFVLKLSDNETQNEQSLVVLNPNSEFSYERHNKCDTVVRLGEIETQAYYFFNPCNAVYYDGRGQVISDNYNVGAKPLKAYEFRVENNKLYISDFY